MSRTRDFVHDDAPGADLSEAGALLTLQTADRDRVSVNIDASVASDFALEVDLGDGNWVTWTTYGSTDSVTDTVTVAAEQVRVQNTTAQTAGDTADVRLGAV